MKTVNFGGISKSVETVKPFDTDWNILLDDAGEMIAETKKVYHHREDGMDFDYVYAVQLQDLEYLTGEDDLEGKFSLELLLVPTVSSFNEKTLARVRESSGEDEVSTYDIVSYGLGIRMAVEQFDAADWDTANEKLAEVNAALDGIDALRGFYLDKAWNWIGTTGWDVINEILFGKDFITTSLDRAKNNIA